MIPDTRTRHLPIGWVSFTVFGAYHLYVVLYPLIGVRCHILGVQCQVLCLMCKVTNWTFDTWHVTPDTYQVTYDTLLGGRSVVLTDAPSDMWQLTGNRSDLTSNTWHLTQGHDTWHMTPNTYKEHMTPDYGLGQWLYRNWNKTQTIVRFLISLDRYQVSYIRFPISSVMCLV